MGSGQDGAPAIIFLVGYMAYFVLLSVLYAKKAIKWKSRYSLVYFHVILRIAGQVCGTAFAFESWKRFDTKLNLLIAYLILSAEGYFSLVICAYRFLVVWQENRFGVSNIEPKLYGLNRRQRIRTWYRSPIAFIHWTLAAANGMIIAGGNLLSSALSRNKTAAQIASARHNGKALRVAGTAIFLALVQVFFLYALQSWRRQKDRTLFFIGLVWPLLTVRGIYGILSVLMSKFSYYNLDIYTESGVKGSFLAGEYILGTLMEFLACGLLIATHFSSIIGENELKEGRDEPEDHAIDKAELSRYGSGEASARQIV